MRVNLFNEFNRHRDHNQQTGAAERQPLGAGKVAHQERQNGNGRQKQSAGENADEILKNILLLSPTNFDEQKKAFSQLSDKLKKNQANLIVVDGMATLYRLGFGDIKDKEENMKELNWKMAEQMRILAEISRKQDIPVIVTNQVYSGFLSEEELRKGVAKKTNLVGGDLLKYWSKCIIELSADGKKRKATLLKHRSLPPKEFSFEIKNEGIFKKGWI